MATGAHPTLHLLLTPKLTLPRLKVRKSFRSSNLKLLPGVQAILFPPPLVIWGYVSSWTNAPSAADGDDTQCQTRMHGDHGRAHTVDDRTEYTWRTRAWSGRVAPTTSSWRRMAYPPATPEAGSTMASPLAHPIFFGSDFLVSIFLGPSVSLQSSLSSGALTVLCPLAPVRISRAVTQEGRGVPCERGPR